MKIVPLYDIIIFVYIISIEGVYLSTCTIGRPYISSSNHECYWLVETLQNFKDHLNICRNDNGSLAVIPNQKVLDFLNAFRKDVGKEYETFYIGYQKVNGSFKELDGKQQIWAHWETGEPNGIGLCVSSGFTNGRFWDEECTSFSYAICQGQHHFDDFQNSTTASTLKQSLITVAINETFKGRPTIQSTKRQSMKVNSSHTLNTIEPCQCLCRPTNHHFDITIDERVEIARNISRKLAVNKETLSSTIRSKTSAEDLRPSAARIGYVGIIILVILFGGLILLDVFTFLNYLFRLDKG